MTTPQLSQLLLRQEDFAVLQSNNHYARYFAQLFTMFNRLLTWYQQKDLGVDHVEASAISMFLRRLLYTIEVLRFKYADTSDTGVRLHIDLTDSGLPNANDLNTMLTDLASRQDRLNAIPSMPTLKRQLSDYLLKYQADSPELLQLLCERTYLEMLDPDKMFLQFSPGVLQRLADGDKIRSYSYTWGCYDYDTNCFYIHIMTFNQDGKQEPLENVGPQQQRFLEAIKGEGSRAPNVGILAMAIDQLLEPIHPKIVKRIRIGPLYSRLLLKPCLSPDHPGFHPIGPVLERYCRQEDDAVLVCTDEIIISKGQTVVKTLLSFSSSVRQVFHIPEHDPTCYEHQASVVHQTIMLPHHLLQCAAGDLELCIPGFSTALKIAYDEQGGIHGVQ